MNVGILGCGGQGSAISGLLALEEVEEILVMDIDPKRAKKLYTRLEKLDSKTKIEAKYPIDARSSEEVSRAGRDVDIIVNATFPNCNIPIAEACLEIGASYIDLVSLPSPEFAPYEQTLDALLDLNDKVLDEDLTWIPNLGAAPGITDVATRYLSEEIGFDAIEKVEIGFYFYIDSDELIAPSAPNFLMGMWLGPPGPVIWEDGDFKKLDLLKSEELWDFPEPTGQRKVYVTTPLPELRTIPEFLPDGENINHVSLKAGLSIGDLDSKEVWIEAIRKQTCEEPMISEKMNVFDKWGESFVPTVDYREKYEEGVIKDSNFAMKIKVTGTRDDRRIEGRVSTVTILDEIKDFLPWVNDLSWVTASVPAYVVQMLVEGKIKGKGVIGPASLENPERILKYVASKGNRIILEKPV